MISARTGAAKAARASTAAARASGRFTGGTPEETRRAGCHDGGREGGARALTNPYNPQNPDTVNEIVGIAPAAARQFAPYLNCVHLGADKSISRPSAVRAARVPPLR